MEYFENSGNTQQKSTALWWFMIIFPWPKIWLLDCPITHLASYYFSCFFHISGGNWWMWQSPQTSPNICVFTVLYSTIIFRIFFSYGFLWGYVEGGNRYIFRKGHTIGNHGNRLWLGIDVRICPVDVDFEDHITFWIFCKYLLEMICIHMHPTSPFFVGLSLILRFFT